MGERERCVYAMTCLYSKLKWLVVSHGISSTWDDGTKIYFKMVLTTRDQGNLAPRSESIFFWVLS